MQTRRYEFPGAPAGASPWLRATRLKVKRLFDDETAVNAHEFGRCVQVNDGATHLRCPLLINPDVYG